MGTIKKFEERIPRFVMSNRTNVMMWTYCHAYKCVFLNKNITTATNLFVKDFDVENETEPLSCGVACKRVSEIFESTSTYEPFELGNIYINQTIDVMIYAWITFYRLHVNNDFDEAVALQEFDTYFNMDMTGDEFDIYLRRYNDMKQIRCDVLPTLNKT